MSEYTLNQKAKGFLDEAMVTSSLVKDKDIERDHIEVDKMYPVNKQETDRMADLLNQAKEAVEDPNEPIFRERFELLDGIVQWSYARHKTWKIILICGILLLAALVMWGRSSTQESTARNIAELKQIEAWTPSDTNLTWDKAKEPVYDKIYTAAKYWKAYELSYAKVNVKGYEKSVEDYKKTLDTATTEQVKNSCLKYMEIDKKKAAETRAEFDKIAAMNFDQIKAKAIEQHKGYIKASESSARTYFIFIVFLVILIGLYIWTGYHYGYELTSSRTRDKILNWIRNFGLKLAAFFFGSGLLAKLFADDYIVKTTFVGGGSETHREADVAGTAINVMFKLGMMAVGIFIFIFISIFIVSIETAFGLKNKLKS